MIFLALHAEFKELKMTFDEITRNGKLHEVKYLNQSMEVFFQELSNTKDTYNRVCYSIALYARVPACCFGKKDLNKYIGNNIKVSRSWRNDCLCVYFNRLGRKALGKGHGHVVIDKKGKIIYYRKIGAKHGPQNYIIEPWLMPTLQSNNTSIAN